MRKTLVRRGRKPFPPQSRWRVEVGDCRELMALMPEASCHAIVTDPPYGLEFMGKEWDRLGDVSLRARGEDAVASANRGMNKSALVKLPEFARTIEQAKAAQQWHQEWAEQALHVLKPGGCLLAFGGTRTYHRLACAVEDVGFEVRDMIEWMYGTGFPKSKNLDGEWKGWGTALKPAHEPIIVARKPFKDTVANNVSENGTGALNIDGCRIETKDNLNGGTYSGGKRNPMPGDARSSVAAGRYGEDGRLNPEDFKQPEGRWPANVILDEEAVVLLDIQSGVSKSQGGRIGKKSQSVVTNVPAGQFEKGNPGFGDTGGASRFFYCAKASRSEREAGMNGFVLQEGGMRSETSGQHITRRDGGDPGLVSNNHPTVKPIALMRYLVRLVTPPDGLVLDPFTGSGTTGIAAMLEGFRFVGMEQDEDYAVIARARIAHWKEEA